MRHLTLLGTLLLAGCAAKQGKLNTGAAPADPLPIILASLTSASGVSEIAGQHAEKSGDHIGCLTGLSLSAALKTASEGVAGNIEGGLLPSVSLDLSSCLELAESSPEGEDIPEMVKPLVQVGIQTVTTMVDIYGSQIECKALAWTKAGLEYAGQVVDVVISEIENPDGIIDLGEVEVGLADCAPAVEAVEAPEAEAPEAEAPEAEEAE